MPAASQIGEGFAGSGPNAAHVNTILGTKGGPVETAWATALATPRSGHVPFVTVLRPNLPVKPLTLFVNKAEVRGDDHARLTWGAAQAGVATGVADAVAEEIVASTDVDGLLLIAAVWVDWTADDEALVYAHNRRATRDALEGGSAGRPSLDDVLAARATPSNPYFAAPD
jgi:5,6,7,8-tetrahydromethanopterin hydro-lyase